MVDRPPECAKCRNAMEPGFVLDRAHGGVAQSTWIDGEAEKSIWVGLRLKGHQRLAVTTYRCPRCGYLESYAPPS